MTGTMPVLWERLAVEPVRDSRPKYDRYSPRCAIYGVDNQVESAASDYFDEWNKMWSLRLRKAGSVAGYKY